MGKKVILDTPEIKLKTGRTNHTTKGRGEATMKKVESVKGWFGREMDVSCCGGEGAVVREKGERHTNTLGSAGENKAPSNCLGKQEGLNFRTSGNGVSKISRLGWKTP